MHPISAHSDDAHPEFSRWESGEVSVDDLTIVPCAPNCALQLAADLGPAWSLLAEWRTRVDAELPGDFVRLLPEVVFAPRAQRDGAAADTSPFADAEADEIPEDLIDLLREELYRSIFALGAAWGHTRGALT